MESKPSVVGRRLIWALVIVLAILHQDFWLWDNQSLLLGFLPIGLGYHMLFSLLAGGLWLLALKIAWPVELENWAVGDSQDAKGGDSQ